MQFPLPRAASDVDAHAVVAGTRHGFRVDDTGQRNVDACSEALEPRLRGVPPAALQALHGRPDALVAAEHVASPKAGRALLAREALRVRDAGLGAAAADRRALA